jgi:hypothetical protein
MFAPVALFLSALALRPAEVRAPAWIPEDAPIVAGFERPGEPLVSHLLEALAFSLDLGDAHQGLLDRIGFAQGAGLERLVFVVLPVEAEGRGVVTIAQATRFPEDLTARLPKPESDLRAEILDRQTLVFGQPAAVARLIEESRRSSGRSDSRAPVWGRATPAALGLAKHAAGLPAADVRGRSVTRSLFGIQEVSFFADFANEARFTLRARVADPADGLFLADALRGFLLPFQADSNDAVAVRDALRRAAISRQSDLVELTLPLTAEALERIRRNEATKRLLRLRLGPEVREHRQNIAAIVEALGVTEGSQVADVGAGDGFFTVRLAWLWAQPDEFMPWTSTKKPSPGSASGSGRLPSITWSWCWARRTTPSSPPGRSTPCSSSTPTTRCPSTREWSASTKP